MLSVLDDIARGRGTHHNCNGLSQHGGRTRILSALRRRGWINGDYKITESGVAAIRESRKETARE